MVLTSVVDQQIQPGLRLQEALSKGAHRLQTGQIEMHEDHLLVSCFLLAKTEKEEVGEGGEEEEESKKRKGKDIGCNQARLGEISCIGSALFFPPIFCTQPG